MFPEDFPDIGDIISWKLIIIVIVVCVIRQYLKGSQYWGKERVKGKVAIVTGASGGIGKQVARELNYRGAKVYLTCRDLTNGQEALTHLVQLGCSLDRLILCELDLSSFVSVRKFVQQLLKDEKQVDFLVNNAALMMVPKFKLTPDMHETQWQVNYLGHYLLTQELLPLLKASESARVINVTCPAQFAAELDVQRDVVDGLVDQRDGYEPRVAFSRSKLALTMHARQLTKELRKEGIDISINTCSPGLAYTRHFRHTPLSTHAILRYTIGPVLWFILKTPKDGAQAILYCLLAPELSGVSGKCYKDYKELEPPPLVLNEEACSDLYHCTKKIVSAQ